MAAMPSRALRVLITGASGSGTTTLAAALAAQLPAVHLDADDFFWLPTDPPFTHQRDRAQRIALFADALRAPRVVASGSVMGWGAEIEDAFDRIVFLRLDTAIRIARLTERELRARGRVAPAFLAWAAQYDAGPPTGRSLATHEAWLAARRCPVIRLEGDLSVEARLALLAPHLPA
jgi:uridine kinase